MEAKLAFFALLLLAGQQLSWQKSLPSDPTYHAGIVEFAPASEGSHKQRVRNNTARMVAIIESEEAKDLDILVFPEYVLNNMDYRTFVPDPQAGIAPCVAPDYDHFLVEISCSARSRGLYVVVNLLEKEVCSPAGGTDCDASGLNTYNTNVVFDRRGVVISRYRKSHLYGYEWYYTNVRATPELATFATDFGVTFGHFICFDMLFYDPAEFLVRQLNITDIIYPTYWFSELPFLTAVQLQEGWAYANDVNLLAADSSRPSGQNTGSGIYAGRLGRLTATINEEPVTRLLKARVPKHDRRASYVQPPTMQPLFVPQLETPRFTELALLRDYNVDIFATRLLDADFTAVSDTVCHGKFCCRFDVRRTFIGRGSAAHDAYRYRLVAYSGADTTFQRMDPSEQSVCAVIACTTEELWSCGRIFPAARLVANEYYFASANVSGSFRHSERRLVMPSTVDGQMMPLHASSYDMSEIESSNATRFSISLTSPKSDLLTFGLWANYYSRQTTNHNLVAKPMMNSTQIPAFYDPHVANKAMGFQVAPVAALLLAIVVVTRI